MVGENVRGIVLDILMDVLEEGKFSHLVIGQALNKYDYLEHSQRSFMKRLAQGVIERKITLDAILNQVSKTPVEKMKPYIRNILRMGTYQLYYMETPSSAAVNESVKLAEKRGLGGLKGFVNGVLRNVDRKKDEWMNHLPIWAKYSMPENLYENLVNWYGEMIANAICEYFLEGDSRGISVRRNTSIISEEKWINKISQDDITVEKSDYSNVAYQLYHVDGLTYNDSFQDGDFQVQDISSILVGEITKDLPSEYGETMNVLDLCAAPGGKSIHQADLLSGKGSITACDINEYKVSMIRENIQRCGFHNIKAVISDATKFHKNQENQFDLVIADLPCSGLGIIGNKPDIKYQAQNQRMEELVQLQRRILKNAALYVKQGGTLVYTTCTLNPRENVENFQWFLEEYPEFEAVDFSHNLCVELQEDTVKNGYLQLLPGQHKSAGFFLSRMKKK